MTIDLDRITNPLTLATGSHKAGSGFGCAMNVVSWTNGDAIITDYPRCSHPILSKLTQALNDSLGELRGTRISSRIVTLRPEDAAAVLDIGFRTVGTAGTLPDQWIDQRLREMISELELRGDAWPILLPNPRRTARYLQHIAADRPWTLSELERCYWDGDHRCPPEDVFSGDIQSFVLDPHTIRGARMFANCLTVATYPSGMPLGSYIERTRAWVDEWRQLAGLDEPVADVEQIDAALAKMAVRA